MIRWLVLVGMAAAGCLPKSYKCASASDCGGNGTCEPNGFCAYADESCAGGARYGDLSGSLSKTCVGDSIEIDAPHAPDAPPDARPDAPPDAPPPPVMFVQQVDPGYATAATVAVPITVTAGNLLIAATYTGLVGTAVTVTDSASSTWTPLTTHELAGCAPRLQLFYTKVAASGAMTVTVSETGSPYTGVHLVEYSGATASPVVVEAGQAAPAASGMPTTGGMTTSERTTIVALFADLSNIGMMTTDTSWTVRGADVNFYTLIVDNAPGVAAGTYTPTATLPASRSDACWTAAAVALR